MEDNVYYQRCYTVFVHLLPLGCYWQCVVLLYNCRQDVSV